MPLRSIYGPAASGGASGLRSIYAGQQPPSAPLDLATIPAATGAAEEAPGVLGNVLRWIGRPGFAVRSILAGEPVDALENAAMFAVDALTPFALLDRDLSPLNLLGVQNGDLTTREERPEFSDVLDAWDLPAPAKDSWARLGVDVLGGIATDPLTYVTGLGGVARGAGKGALTGLSREAAEGALKSSLGRTAAGRSALQAAGGSGERVLLDELGRLGKLDQLPLHHASTAGRGAEEASGLRRAFQLQRQAEGGAPLVSAPRLTGHVDQGPLLDEALESLAQRKVLAPEGLRFKVPFRSSAKVVPIPGLGRAAGAVGRHVGAPGAAGGLAAGALGLPAELGAAAGPAAWAGARKLAPDFVQGAEAKAGELWRKAQTKLYSKFQDSRVAEGAQRFARWVEQQRLGRNAAARKEVIRLFQATTAPQREAVTDVLNEFADVHQGLLAAGGDVPSVDQLRPRIAEQVAERAGLAPEKAEEVVGGYLEAMNRVKDELKEFGIVSENAPDALYVPHQTAGHVLKALEEAGLAGGNPTLRRGLKDVFTKRRSYDTAEEFERAIRDKVSEAGLGHLLEGELGVTTRDAADLMLQRLEAHNKTWASQTFTREAKKRFGLEAGHPMERVMAEYSQRVLGGIPPRESSVAKALHKINRLYKPALTVVFPGFHFRNALSAVYQTMLDPDLGPKEAGALAWRLLRDAPIVRGLGKGRGGASGDEVMTLLNAINNPADEAAQAAAAGLRIGQYRGDEVVNLAQQGVVGTQHFAEAELIEDLGFGLRDVMAGSRERGIGASALEIARPTGVAAQAGPAAGRYQRALELAGRMSRFVEDRARLGAFLAHLKKGNAADEAITRTQRAFVDYSFNSWEERVLRDLIPFVRFQLGMTPVVAREVARRPALVGPIRAAAGSVEGQEGSELLPDEARQGLALPLGEGRYLRGLGLPVEAAAEAFEAVPTPSRGTEGFRRGVLAGLTPALRTPVEAASGVDFYTGRRFGYAAQPAGPLGELLASPRVGRDGEVRQEISPRQQAALGVSPLSRVEREGGRVLEGVRALIQGDPRAALAPLARAATGLHVDAPDQRRFAERLLEAHFEKKLLEGDVGVLERYFTRGEVDPELAQAFEAHQALERERRQARKAEKGRAP